MHKLSSIICSMGNFICETLNIFEWFSNIFQRFLFFTDIFQRFFTKINGFWVKSSYFRPKSLKIGPFWGFLSRFSGICGKYAGHSWVSRDIPGTCGPILRTFAGLMGHVMGKCLGKRPKSSQISSILWHIFDKYEIWGQKAEKMG